MRLCRKYGSEIAHDGQPEPTTENHSEKAKNPLPSPTCPICMACGKNPVELVGKLKKPRKAGGDYYGLCVECRKKAKTEKDHQQQVDPPTPCMTFKPKVQFAQPIEIISYLFKNQKVLPRGWSPYTVSGGPMTLYF